MANSLRAIQAPIEKDLEAFEHRFRDAMRSPAPLLDRITFYIVRRKGKQVRPMFVFLAAKMCGGVTEHTYTAAALVELLHTATLVHDDVVDDSFERRGFFSVNALWKNKIAVLVGDYLLSRGMLLALRTKQYGLLEIVSNAIEAMAEGELLQIEKARRLDIDEAVYYEVIRQKTASLIAAACKAGAASSTSDADTLANIHSFGEKIGIAFQIRDDLFDFGASDVGKPLGIDIKEKKMTLPLIYALRKADPTTRKNIINSIRKDSENPAKVQEIINFVRESGGLDYAREVMYTYRREAFELLHTFPESPARQSLEELVNYVVEREK